MMLRLAYKDEITPATCLGMLTWDRAQRGRRHLQFLPIGDLKLHLLPVLLPHAAARGGTWSEASSPSVGMRLCDGAQQGI
jgi:hypothetical protein